MSELTLYLLQYGFLLVMWLFVLAVIFSVRADIFGVKVRKLPAGHTPAAPASPTPTPTPTPAPAPKPSPAGPRIVITSGTKSGLEVPLPSDGLTIGRSNESGLVIRDDYTSSRHARLVKWGENWMIQDLESTNGTYLDGVRVDPAEPRPLSPGATVKVGATSFELRK